MPWDPRATTTRRGYLRTALCAVGSAAGVAGCFSTDDSESTPSRRGAIDPSTAGRTPSGPGGAGASTAPGGGAEPTDGAGGDPAESLPSLADEYETAINVVDEGVSPDGQTSLQSVLDGTIGDDVMLYFPEGQYLIDGRWNLSSARNVALVGDGATIVPPPEYEKSLFYFGKEDAIETARVEGLTFDFTAPETGPRPLNLTVRDELTVEDVVVRGSTRVTRFGVLNGDGRGRIRRLRLPDGGIEGAWAVGCYVGPDSHGEILFEDCVVSGFPNNGLYASASNGPIHVEGGTYSNNGIANIRVKGPSTVRDATVRCTGVPDYFQNLRGIWLRDGSCVVEGCDVELRDVTYSGGAIVVGAHGEIRDTNVRVDADDVPGVRIYHNTDSPTETGVSDGLQCSNVDIRGSGAKNAAVLLYDRDNCKFEGFTVRQSGPDRDGFHLIRSNGSSIRNSTISVTGEPLLFERSDVRTADVDVSSSDVEPGGDRSDPTDVREGTPGS